MRRMILHIGTHKTGSSSLQRFFFNHREALSERGIFYPIDEHRPEVTHRNLAYSISHLEGMQRLYTPEGMTFDKLAAMLKTRDEDVILISAEAFLDFSDMPDKVDLIKNFAKAHDLTVDVVVLVRPQHLFFESLYTQACTGIRTGLPFHEFIEQHLETRKPAHVRFFKIWDDAPDMRLIALPFTAAQLKPDLETAFFEAVGLAGRVGNLLRRVPRIIVNPRPGAMTVELGRRAAFLFGSDPERNSFEIEPARLDEISDYLKTDADKHGWNETPFRGLNNAAVDRLAGKFAGQNRAFAKRFWDDSWADIFAADYEPDFVPNDLGQRQTTTAEELALEEGLRRIAKPFGLRHDWSWPRVTHDQNPVIPAVEMRDENSVIPAVEAALAHYRAGRLVEAGAACRQALAIDPDHPKALTLQADIACVTGRPNDAIVLMERAIAATPDMAQLHYNLGEALRHAGRADAACDAYQRAVDLKGDYVPALHNLAGLLVGDGQLTRAVALFHRALDHRPDSPDLHYNLAFALERLDDPEAAVEHYARAVALRPEFPTAHHNLGNALRGLGRLDEAVAAYRACLAADPEHGDASQHFGACLALMGQWVEGLREYEWGRRARTHTLPSWNGTAEPGKTILLWADRGLGDDMLFIRYAPLVRKMVGRVVVECRPSMMRLLSSLDGVDELVAADQDAPDFDFDSALTSLPYLFGTTPDTVPATVPYLAAEPELVETWRDRLAGIDGYRVGIVWHAGPGSRSAMKRYIPLACFAQLADIPGVRLIVLQKHAGREQIEDRPGDFSLIDLGPELDTGPDAFVDTAAVMMNLDLIVTSDTSIAHLAGALGRPVWVALPTFPNWRWLLERDDSPWYPTMRLFRQPTGDDWPAVFDAMATALEIVKPDEV